MSTDPFTPTLSREGRELRELLILNERDRRHPNAGGAEVNLFEIGGRLARAGYRVTLLCSRFAGAATEEILDGIRVVRLGNLPAYYLRLPLEVRRRVRTHTVVIEHLCRLPFCSPVYARVPVLPVTHHLFGRTAFRQASLPIAAGVFLAEKLIPPVYRQCFFIAVSPSTRSDLAERGIAPERIRVIPNGVDCTRYMPPPSPPPGPPALLVLGRVEPYKRIGLTLHALRRVSRDVPEVRLVIAGGGTGLDAVRREIRRLGLEAAVRCTGPVAEDEKLRCLHAASLVLNSSEKEGWGLTILEAAACGLPAVAMDVPGLRDSVLDGRTGILVPDGDVEAMAAETVKLLRDAELRRQLGVAARAWAGKFSWDAAAQATARCIEEVAAENTPRCWSRQEDAYPDLARCDESSSRRS